MGRNNDVPTQIVHEPLSRTLVLRGALEELALMSGAFGSTLLSGVRNSWFVVPHQVATLVAGSYVGPNWEPIVHRISIRMTLDHTAEVIGVIGRPTDQKHGFRQAFWGDSVCFDEITRRIVQHECLRVVLRILREFDFAFAIDNDFVAGPAF